MVFKQAQVRHMLIVSDSKIVIHEQAVCLICNNDIVNNSGMG